MTFTPLCNARYSKCLHRPIVIMNQHYTKGEIHFIIDRKFNIGKFFKILQS